MEKEYIARGMILACVGGLYRCLLDEDASALGGKEVLCVARGVLRHREERPMVGDRVEISYTDRSFSEDADGNVTPSENGTDIAVTSVIDRRNALIRPPLANIDHMLVFLSAKAPVTLPSLADKLIAICEHNKIEPLIVISKSDLDDKVARELHRTYSEAGFPTFLISSMSGEGIEELRGELEERMKGEKIAACSGVSGAGKSTLINRLCPELSLDTFSVSRKTERGRHTTRAVTLYSFLGGYLADTPGFSLLDFERFDFFDKEDLPYTFREFEECFGKCRYADCTHTKEEGCAVLEAVKEGRIARSRHESYLELYNILKMKPSWKK